ncbi:hypothetical protein Acr_00g0037790 [Actinidia rufa]|uniref:Uncharacterized protein n=1 Tax=Actinidia rufa TaxID=165716 RepID=A0A7J0DH08_9ERIC|nr:hypothetical protein Acr_00g0037790 [Actinidia rufa]
MVAAGGGRYKGTVVVAACVGAGRMLTVAMGLLRTRYTIVFSVALSLRSSFAIRHHRMLFCSFSVVLDHRLTTANVNSDRSATLSPSCLLNATVKIWPPSMLILTVSPWPMSISTVLPPSLSLRCPDLVYRQHTNTIVVISMPSVLQ